MITDGCVIGSGAKVERSVLAPGVQVMPGAKIRESILMTDAVIKSGAVIEQAIIDKRVVVEENAVVGRYLTLSNIALVGKNSFVPAGMQIEPGAVVGTDVITEDYPSSTVRGQDYIQTKRLPYEV